MTYKLLKDSVKKSKTHFYTYRIYIYRFKKSKKTVELSQNKYYSLETILIKVIDMASY